MKPNRPNNRASTEAEALIFAIAVLGGVVTLSVIRQVAYGFSQDPAGTASQVSNIANDIGNFASAAPGLVAVIIIGLMLVAHALE